MTVLAPERPLLRCSFPMRRAESLGENGDRQLTPFARWLEDAMQARGFNQSELARASGLKQNTISTYFRLGRVPEDTSLEKIIRALLP